MGSDCKSQMLFPSKDTDGAAMLFMVDIRHIIKVRMAAEKSVESPNIGKMFWKISSPLKSRATPAKRRNSIPNPQFNMYPELEVNRRSSLKKRALPADLLFEDCSLYVLFPDLAVEVAIFKKLREII